MAATLDLMDDQSTRRQNAIFQHRTVLDYWQKEEFAGNKINPAVAYKLMTTEKQENR